MERRLRFFHMKHSVIHNPKKSDTMTLVRFNNRRLPLGFDGLFQDFFNDFPSFQPLQVPPVNVLETPAAYQLEVIAPGLNKEDLSVQVENGLLTVAWEKKEEKNQTENGKVLRREFRQRSFKRTFSVDDSVDTEKIDAKYENGVLKIVLPKNASAPATKQISVQ